MSGQTLVLVAASGAAATLGNRAREPYRTLIALGALLALVATRVVSPLVLLFGAALIGVLRLGFWAARRRAGASVRGYALGLGVCVEEVERDLPYTSSRGTRLTLRRGRTTRYWIPRLGSAAPAEWAFLMRSRKEGAQYPHGFLFRSGDGGAPDAMAELLTRIARDSDQEYLEFEASRSEVSAFWDAWGGRKEFDRVHRLLRQLAEF